MFGLEESEVSVSEEGALSGVIKCHYGDLNVDFSGKTSAEGVKLPERVLGKLTISGNDLLNTQGLELLKAKESAVSLRGLQDAQDLKIPKSFTGKIYFSSSMQRSEREALLERYPGFEEGFVFEYE